MGIMDSEQGGIDSEVRTCGGGWQIIHVVLRDVGVNITKFVGRVVPRDFPKRRLLVHYQNSPPFYPFRP